MNPTFPQNAFGVTSTIPIEVPLAAGRQVVDLNNLFITSPDPLRYVRVAEAAGFPRNCCSWIRGLYGLIRECGIKRVIFVTGGDCSNTHALMETLQPDLSEVFTFSFPLPGEKEALSNEIDRFCTAFGVTRQQAEQKGNDLAEIRRMLEELDRRTWQTETVSGVENFQWLVSASDFQGNPETFQTSLRQFLNRTSASKKHVRAVRLGLLGVPPIQSDLLQVIEELGGKVVFNEIPRQFALLGPSSDLTERYLEYTYPYGVRQRIDDIRQEIRRRNIHGLIHYTQSFCHRQIHDIVLRRELSTPILTIEGENPGPCDNRTRLRIESFLEIQENTGRQI